MVLRIKKQETIRVEKYRLDHRLSVHREDKEIEEYSDNVQASQEFEQRQIFFGFQNYSTASMKLIFNVTFLASFF